MPMTSVTMEDQQYTPKALLEYLATRPDKAPVTLEIAKGILDANTPRDYISTTSLTSKCMRAAGLKANTDYTESVEGLWAAWRGTAMHSSLEKAAQGLDGVVPEARFHTDVAKVLGRRKRAPFSGSPDIVDVGKGEINDWKFTREGKAPRYGNPWAEHVEQANLNRWLVDHSTKVEYQGKTWTEVEAFRPMDWTAMRVTYLDDRGATPITITKSIQIPKKDGNGTKAARVTDVWSDQQVEDLIRDRYPVIEDSLSGKNIPAPPPGWEHQSHILCSFCPVRAACADLEAQGK